MLWNIVLAGLVLGDTFFSHLPELVAHRDAVGQALLKTSLVERLENPERRALLLDRFADFFQGVLVEPPAHFEIVVLRILAEALIEAVLVGQDRPEIAAEIFLRTLLGELEDALDLEDVDPVDDVPDLQVVPARHFELIEDPADLLHDGGIVLEIVHGAVGRADAAVKNIPK